MSETPITDLIQKHGDARAALDLASNDLFWAMKTKIGELERENAELRQCIESLWAILQERKCLTCEDHFDIGKMVNAAMEGERPPRRASDE